MIIVSSLLPNSFAAKPYLGMTVCHSAPHSTGCSVGMDPRDLICFSHIKSVFASHHVPITKIYRSVEVYIGTSASETRVRELLIRDAPRSQFQYTIGSESEWPRIQRRWIPISLSSLENRHGSRSLPPSPVYDWVRHKFKGHSDLVAAYYAPVHYLDGNSRVTGYHLREVFSQANGTRRSIEEQLPAGRSAPYTPSPFVPQNHAMTQGSKSSMNLVTSKGGSPRIGPRQLR